MPSLAEAQQRYQESAPTASRRYQEGTRGKSDEWFEGASNSEENYSSGVQQAIAEGRFAAGVRDAGPGAWNEGVTGKGVANYPNGLRLGGTKYARKVQPFVALWDAPLSTPRGPRRSPANAARITENITRFINAAQS